MARENPVLIGEQSWVEIVNLAETEALAILPVGSVEQHGPHLPLLVDTIQVEAIASEVSRRTGAPVAPPLVYSSSQGHSRMFPGTLALTPNTAQTAIQELCWWLYNAGFRKIFVLNGHVGNIGVIWNAADNAQFQLPHDVSIQASSWWNLNPSLWKLVTSDVPTSEWEFHANWAETSLMLFLRPSLVHMERAVNMNEQPWPFAYDMSKKSRSGVIGRQATTATPEGGEAIFEAAVSAVVTSVEQMQTANPVLPLPEDLQAWRREVSRKYLAKTHFPPQESRIAGD